MPTSSNTKQNAAHGKLKEKTHIRVELGRELKNYCKSMSMCPYVAQQQARKERLPERSTLNSTFTILELLRNTRFCSTIGSICSTNYLFYEEKLHSCFTTIATGICDCIKQHNSIQLNIYMAL